MVWSQANPPVCSNYSGSKDYLADVWHFWHGLWPLPVHPLVFTHSKDFFLMDFWGIFGLGILATNQIVGNIFDKRRCWDSYGSLRDIWGSLVSLATKTDRLTNQLANNIFDKRRYKDSYGLLRDVWGSLASLVTETDKLTKQILGWKLSPVAFYH